MISNDSRRARRVNIGGDTSPGEEGRDMLEGQSYVIRGTFRRVYSAKRATVSTRPRFLMNF